MATPERVGPPPWARPLVTLAAPALVWLAWRIALPGVDAEGLLEKVPFYPRSSLSPFWVPIATYATFALMVEAFAAFVPKLRPLRFDGLAGRNRLARVAAALFI